MAVAEIATAVGKPATTVGTTLTKLKGEGKVESGQRGYWRRKPEAVVLQIERVNDTVVSG